MHAHIDFETYSLVDLPKCGSDVYAEGPSTEVLCMAYAIGEGEVKLWIDGDPLPHDLFKHIRNGITVVGHNIGGFEMLVWNNIMAPKYGWPTLDIEQCEDTMAMAYAMGLPGSLDRASAATGMSHQKDMKGSRVMLQLCKPRSNKDGVITRWPKDHAKYQILYDYCKQDVVVERELYKRLLKLSESELEMWRLDWKINRRGVKLDLKSASIMRELADSEKTRLNIKMKEVTNCAVSTCNATGQLTDWLKYKGLEVPSVAKADVLEMLSKDIPDECRKALQLRQEAGKTSTAKLDAMLRGTNSDSRIRGMFQYHGATTGRWAGRRLQLHNLPRPTISQKQIENVFSIVIGNLDNNDKLEYIDMLYSNPLARISDCLRGFLTCDEDKYLIGVDFSAIEARVLAWLAGEKKVLDVFLGHGKLYEHSASNIFRIPIEEVNKDQRQIGKVAELALGYQGGVGAFQKMSKGYGLDLSDEQALEIKNAWRTARIKTVQYWGELERKSIVAFLNPGEKIKAGPVGREATFLKSGSFLWCRLPSGRSICYPYPELNNFDTPWGDIKEGLTYMGTDAYTNKWKRINTYGGKLCENITQAVAADLLRHSITQFEAKGHEVVMHVHDECVIESNTLEIKEAEEIMCEVPKWAIGIPIGAEGWKSKRFRK